MHVHVHTYHTNFTGYLLTSLGVTLQLPKHAAVCVCLCVCVGSCLATKIFIGKLSDTREGVDHHR